MSYYLFIDGAYLREAYERAMKEFYGVVPPMNFSYLRDYFSSPERIYYYDAVDRNRIGNETPTERDQRVKERDEFHAYLNALPSWHVREGFVSRGRRASRRSQKAVDVQLAVDALEHAVARNMERAAFILGDLDFEPLLFSLNRFGVRTTVWYERRSAIPELLEAADVREQLTLGHFHAMSSPDFKGDKATPVFYGPHGRPGGLTPLRVGKLGERRVELLPENSGGHFMYLAPGLDPVREQGILVHHPDPDPSRVERAFTITYGDVVWT